MIEAINAESSTRPMNLLFVDDERNILNALKRLFRSSEYSIHTAESGMDALQILDQHPIDLIVSDMRMPHMDGAEFLSLAAERWPDTIRILLTGYADLESTIAAVNKGRIHSYCGKPWEDNELKLQINNALEQKRLKDERQRLFAIIHQQNAELKELNTHLEEKVEHRTEQLRSSLQQIDQAHNALKKQYTDAVKAFARIIEMRPGIKSGHSLYVAENARHVAQKMGLDQADVKDIVYAGLLLQIGKMSLDDELLHMPLHPMSSFHKKRYMQHAQEGWSLLRDIDRLKNAAELILHQYEYYDGSGEPNSLRGDEIPLGSRILAVVRDYICYLDGFITGSTMSVDQAKCRLLQRKNKDYDPDVVEMFLMCLAQSVYRDERPVIDVSWTQIRPGMEAAEITCNDRLYLKDTILTADHIDNIFDMRKQSQNVVIKIRV